MGGARRGAKRPRVQRALGGRLERREGQRRIRTCHRKIKGLRFSAFRAKRETGENPSCNCRCRDPPSTPLGPCAPLPPCLFGPLCSLPPLAHVRESAEPRCPWALPPSCCVAGHPASPALAADALGSATAAAWQLPGLASPRFGLFLFFLPVSSRADGVPVGTQGDISQGPDLRLDSPPSRARRRAGSMLLLTPLTVGPCDSHK